LSNQSDLRVFFSPWKVNLKFPINSGIRQAGIACACWFPSQVLF
jgi:hypothetical protein